MTAEIAKRVASQHRNKTAASLEMARYVAKELPTLRLTQQEWLVGVAKATADYWNKASGGWTQFRIKAKVSGGLWRPTVDIDAEGWTAYISYSLENGKVIVNADISEKKGEVEWADVDFMAILDQADTDSFSKTYAANVEPAEMITDVSLHYSTLANRLDRR